LISTISYIKKKTYNIKNININPNLSTFKNFKTIKIAINIKIKRNVIPPSVKIRNLLPDSFLVKDKKIANTRKLNSASPIPAKIDNPVFTEMKLKFEQTIVKQNRIIEISTGFLILCIKFFFII
jgi:hypothetical protein